MLLAAVHSNGEAACRANHDLAAIVYDELNEIARSFLHREHVRHRPDTASLVNEAYMRLIGSVTQSGQQAGGARTFENRRHFYGAAALAMRRILIDEARERLALKRGGRSAKASNNPEDAAGLRISDSLSGFESLGASPDQIDAALDELRHVDPRSAEVVHLRFFACLSETQVANLLALSDRQVRRDWQHARAWLIAKLRPKPENSR